MVSAIPVQGPHRQTAEKRFLHEEISAPQRGSTLKRDQQRIHEIDGMRGWSALVVITFHYVWETFGIVQPSITNGYVKFFLDGPLAVCVFFVLSGDALSTPFLQSERAAVWQSILAKRYFRLTIPILMSTSLTFVLMCSGVMFNHEAAVVVHRPDWYGRFLAFDPTLLSSISFSLAGVYGWTATPNYNEFLLSMMLEMTGSMLILLFVPLVFVLRRPLLTICILGAVAFVLSDYYGLFFVGLLLAYMRRLGVFDWLRAARFSGIASTALFLLVYLGDFRRQASPMPAANSADLLSLVEVFWRDNYFSIAAPTLVFAVYINRTAVKFLSMRLSQYFGRISFAAFLLQMAVLCSFLSYLITVFANQISSLPLCIVIAGVSIGVCIVAADAFSRVEAVAMRLVNVLVALAFIKS